MVLATTARQASLPEEEGPLPHIHTYVHTLSTPTLRLLTIAMASASTTCLGLRCASADEQSKDEKLPLPLPLPPAIAPLVIGGTKSRSWGTGRYAGGAGGWSGRRAAARCACATAGQPQVETLSRQDACNQTP